MNGLNNPGQKPKKSVYQFKTTIQSLKQKYSPKTESGTHSPILKMAKI